MYSIDIARIDMLYDDFLDFYSLCSYFAKKWRMYDVDFDENSIYCTWIFFGCYDDNNINCNDVIQILKYDVGLIVEF